MIFIKRIPSIEDCPLETSEVVVDRQLRHIAILDANRDCVYLLTTIMVLHHIIEFKTEFEKTHKYSMETSLKPHRTIKNSKSVGMLSTMFGSVKKKDILAISYYNGLIEMYQNKKNWSICMSLNLSPRLARVQLIDSTLYTIQYSKDVSCYDLNNNGTVLNNSIFNARQILLQTTSGILYESHNGDLMDGKEIAIKNSSQTQKNSIEDLENDNFGTSFCQRYIFQYVPCIVYRVENKNEVTKVCEFNGNPTVVSISPFSYEIGDIALLVYENTLELWRLTEDKYKANRTLLKIKNIKHVIERIIWIGPLQILLLDEEEKMSFLQIFSSKLFI